MRYFLLLLVFVSALAHAHGDEISTGFWSATAIEGYDSVAYHGEQGSPTKGDKTYDFEWKSAIWHFDSEQNRDLFASDPEKYAPQYGGHCANAMSLGKKVKSDAEIWTIIGDKLYLFAGKAGLERWQAHDDVQALINEADTNWKTEDH